uniref:Uncharacterized protein n=1 Tax=Anthurium amnicola TaxID=1678845 RepID=A0A1D1XPC6_9ARAE
MSDSEVRPNMVGSNRSKNVYNLSIALAPHLGIPTDVIEQAIIKAIEQNTNIFNALPSPLHNGIQETKPVDELSQSSALISPGSNHDIQHSLLDIDSKNQESSKYKINRKDSLSSLIEITQSGSTSINIKLPSLHVPPPTVQGEMINGRNSPQSLEDVNTSPIDENLNRPQYYDEQNTYNGSNNEDLMRNVSDYDYSKEYIPPQRRDNYVQNTPEVENRQIDSTFDAFKEYISPQAREHQAQDTYKPSNQDRRQQRDNRFQDKYDSDDFPDEYIQPQRREFQDSYPQVVSPIKNNLSDTYLSDFPSLSEAAKRSDSRKNSGVDLGAWGQMDLNIASAWGKPKKWSSETETNTNGHPATPPAWNSDDANFTWKPIQDPKPPINKKKPAPVNFEFDDTEGWGTPPSNTIPWDDSRQGYCVDLIKEQKETVFWSMQNGNWVNVSEEYSITSEKKTVEYTSDGVNHKNIRQTRTRVERQESLNIDNGITWEDLRERTRREREQKARGLINDETTNEDIIIQLTDDNSDSSENYRSSSNMTTRPERLGNPQWKTEKEWRHDRYDYQPRQFNEEIEPRQFNEEVEPRQFNQEVECGDLINLDMHDISESKGPKELLTATSDREENDGQWDKWGEISERSREEIANDAWFNEDMHERQEDMNKESNQNILINIDSNNDNEVTESTIINTHPPIFHGRVNNEMAEDLNDILLSPGNAADTANMNVINNELSLLSFDDDENNKVSDSSANQENDNKYNFDKLEVFLKSDIKSSEVIEDSNESQEKAPVLPYVINDSEMPVASPRPYRCENSSQDNIESMNSSSAIDVNNKDNEHNQYSQVLDQYEQMQESVNEPQSAADPNSNEPDLNSKAETNGKDFIINLTVETPSDGRQILRLRYDDDPQVAATEFCRRWDMFHFEDALKGFVQKEQKRRLRKRRTKCKK